jgi:hypothetical protein
MKRVLIILCSVFLSTVVFSSDTPCSDNYSSCIGQGVPQSTCYAVWLDCMRQKYGYEGDPLNQAPGN